jgi:two-component system response regulator AtoC
MVFTSTAMHEVQAMIEAVAPTDTTVLILGESGTGKEMVARAIHEHSQRAAQELVAIDGTALQENLFESELFGHERGAFTGAEQQKKGLIEEAKGGSLLLDEIGDIGPSIQAKLLRVMETNAFRRLGGTKTLAADVRFIAATNRDLAKMSSSGDYRADLYFRLSPFVITVPPLRERREDIAPLAQHFLAGYTGTMPMKLTAEALNLLVAYDWPGNARELRNAIERAVILARPGRQVRAQNLSFLPRSQQGETVLRFSQEPTLEQIEREYLHMILAKYGGNRLKTAAALGVSERHIYRLIEKYRGR